MAMITLQVSFDADAFELLERDPLIDMAQPRRIFTIEDLMPLGVLPGPGDLVLDPRLHPAAWLVQQRTARFDNESNCTIGLLVGKAPEERAEFLKSADPVALTPDASAALFAEHIGRPMPSVNRLVATALQAHPDLRPGDVLQDAAFSRHHLCVSERAFVWAPGSYVGRRFLLDWGTKAADRDALGLPDRFDSIADGLSQKELELLLACLRDIHQARGANNEGGSA